jgi:hypothetical protein
LNRIGYNPQADFDVDGDVDFFDFVNFAGHYLRVFEGPPYPTPDVDWDGDVDFHDFALLARFYGKRVLT